MGIFNLEKYRRCKINSAITIGININDKTQPYTAQILDGSKTVETRRSRSLHCYVGRRVGIVRTGVGTATLVGYATIGKPVWYGSVEEFRADYRRHLVAPDSQHDCDTGGKWGYPLIDVQPVAPRVIRSRGIVARKI